jgi:coenzyme Q-binding protein COQ10
MPTFHTVRSVPYSPAAMMDLVADVERYPEFLPFCERLTVLARTATGVGLPAIKARMDVGYGPLSESFTTEVVIDRGHNRIDVTNISGPFRVLENVWTFRPTPSGCDVDFRIRYEFRSFALQLLLGSMFDHVFRRFAEAFEARARTVYGTVGRVPSNRSGTPASPPGKPALSSLT